LRSIICIEIVLIVEIGFKRIFFLIHGFLSINFITPLVAVGVGIFLFLHQDIGFGNLYLFILLSDDKRTLLLFLWFGGIGFDGGEGKCFGGLDIVGLMVGVGSISISGDRVVVIGDIDVVVGKLVVLELSSGVDLVVMVSPGLGAMVSMVLLIFFISVFR